ncbi:hypothetical protein AHAS_Ahas11G0157600 [Arachis hypogaea]
MLTRSKTGHLKPKTLQAQTLPASHILPKSVKAALQSPHWKEAMLTEYRALVHHQTWTLVEAPPNEKIISCKWIFAVKRNSKGDIIRHKARLVARGFNQTVGVDFDQVFSPVVKPVTICLILTLALSKGWTLKQLACYMKLFI